MHAMSQYLTAVSESVKNGNSHDLSVIAEEEAK
jgi:hypothetical protein